MDKIEQARQLWHEAERLLDDLFAGYENMLPESPAELETWRKIRDLIDHASARIERRYNHFMDICAPAREAEFPTYTDAQGNEHEEF
jgi:hypothetical protein